jgi:hypothetical protein
MFKPRRKASRFGKDILWRVPKGFKIDAVTEEKKDENLFISIDLITCVCFELREYTNWHLRSGRKKRFADRQQ